MLERQKMPEQDPKVRRTNFNEVSLALQNNRQSMRQNGAFNARNQNAWKAAPSK